ncbi:MAG TPA: LuxR C-terminal-related transcriptional regulator [Desertimonas sp.]|nr:LuxR C-terminal-related transcriptional regulator [Desertimonas sp.]
MLYRGHCFMHRAEILELLGAWPEALVEARHACDRLAAPVHPAALAAACVIEGDLLRLTRDFDGADTAYQRASEYGRDPQPGLALLRLAEGRLETAKAMIRRALDEAQDPISRARLLAPYVEIVLATGDTTPAADAAEELRQVAATIGTPLMRAHAARAAGAVLIAEGDPKTALVELRRAFDELNSLGMLYHGARTRLLIADACAAVGDHDSAEMESSAARSVLEALTPTATLLNATVEPGTTSSPDGLTKRELEILRLLAQGKTNRGIAQELVISEKTVASHVSHIFTKLGVTSRSAATAHAYDHNLVR